MTDFSINCPLPLTKSSQILLAHGGGGDMTRQFLETHIAPLFHNQLTDSAIINHPGGSLAFTTDAFVVSPVFFPGGSIGDLAVNGTVNDLAVSGATPLALSLALILEEGCPLATVDRVMTDVAKAAEAANVSVVTGDTKVVERGTCDRLYLITSGIGVVSPQSRLGFDSIKPGDQIIINGSIGDHGMAIMSAREHFEFETPPQSDTCPLNHLVADSICPAIHFMRDATRGGVAAVLNEISSAIGYNLLLTQESLPISENVKAACALLGFDPLHVANEGKLVMFVDAAKAPSILKKLRHHPDGKQAAIIGEVQAVKEKRVILKTAIGAERLIHTLSGEQLPRIC